MMSQYTNDQIKMKSIAADLNNLTFNDYYNRLMLLTKSVFKWNNLPNGIDEKWIERWLYTEGKCIFFKDKQKGFMVLRCNEVGQLNYYDEPTSLVGYGTNMQQTTRLENFKDCVLIRNNDDMIPTYLSIQLYAMRLAEAQRTIDINMHAQRTPIVIRCSERQRMTFVNLYKKYDGFSPIIFADKDIDLDGVKVLKTDAPVVFPQCELQKHHIWNEAMTFIGINNANQDKRERLVDDEVQANNEQIEMSANVFLKAREKAAELINKLYPELEKPVSVEMRKFDSDEIEQLLGGVK